MTTRMLITSRMLPTVVRPLRAYSRMGKTWCSFSMGCNIHRRNNLVFSSIQSPLSSIAHFRRFINTEAQPEPEKSSEEKTENSFKKTRKEIKKGAKLFGAGGISVACAIFLYIYSNAPAKEWPARIRETLDIVKQTLSMIREHKKAETHEAFKDLLLARKIHRELGRVRQLIEEKKLEDNFEKLILQAEQNHQQELKEQDLTHDQKIVKYKNKIAQFKKEKEETVHLMQKSGQEEKGQLTQEISKLKLEIHLYQECSDADCTKDLKFFLLGKDIVKFGHKHVFSPKYFDLLKQALTANLNPTVKKLDFHSTFLQSNNGVNKLMEGLMTNTTIERLDLGWTDLGNSPHDIIAVTDMLRANRTLKEISLYYSHFNDRDAESLKLALLDNKVLKKLDLRDTNVNENKKRELRTTLNIEIL